MISGRLPFTPKSRGTYRRDAGDGEHVEIVIAERVYRVRRAELRPG